MVWCGETWTDPAMIYTLQALGTVPEIQHLALTSRGVPGWRHATGNTFHIPLTTTHESDTSSW